MQHFNTQPTLENELVLIRPLSENDFEFLFKIASDPEIWEQHPAKERSERDGFTKFFNQAIETKSAFAIIDKQTNSIIGSSRYNFCNDSEKAIEIGWTFIAKKFWGGSHNKSIKHLMLDHAFKTFDIVIFCIDKNNIRSQKAVEKIGGKIIDSIDGKILNKRTENTIIYSIEKLL